MFEIGGRKFKSAWGVDAEFGAGKSKLSELRCIVAHDFVSDRRIKLWSDDLKTMKEPPYEIGEDDLFIAYFSSAEFSCHKALGWELPKNVLDLFAEFRVLTNGQKVRCGNGLIGAQAHLGIESIEYAEKETMRALALRGGEYTEREKHDLLEYCESDVIALKNVLDKLMDKIDIDRALLRGQYMKVVSEIEFRGIPLDEEALERFRAHWEDLKQALVDDVNEEFQVYEGMTFKSDRFAQYLVKNRMTWPMTPSGYLDLKDETFKEMSRPYPFIGPLRDTRSLISQLKLNDISTDGKGRSRAMISPFRSKTGRTQGNGDFIYTLPAYMRSLIKPEKGMAIAYVDICQEEFAIGAALSGDENMLQAYLSGDPYLHFAILAEAAPPDATKKSHPEVREQYKECSLAVQYGMGATTLSMRIQKPEIYARILLLKHKTVFKKFWQYSDAVVDFAAIHGFLTTAFGWRMEVDSEVGERTIRNFPMQANGADILRIWAILAAERGVKILATVHDALLIEAPIEEIENHVEIAKTAAGDASALVLDGLRLRCDSKVYRYPERYMDERGTKMWETMTRLLERIEREKAVRGANISLCVMGTLLVLLEHIRSILFVSC